MARKYSKGASKKVETRMRKRKRGTLKSGRSGRKVKSRKQAIAIGLSERAAKARKSRRGKRRTLETELDDPPERRDRVGHRGLAHSVASDRSVILLEADRLAAANVGS